tara:strand:- start:4218 stop:5075 length:858 start_codon:yes stop_codon:yes gene_type:complete
MSEAEQVVQSEATPAATVSIETPAEIAQGGSGNDFLSSIPEDLREHPSLSPIKDVGNLARSYINAQRLIGADKIPMPVNPTDDDLDNIYSKLGRPETPSQYNIAADGNVLTEERATEYSEIAHKLRLNPDQAQGVLDYYRSVVQNDLNASNDANAQAMESATASLQSEWGDKFEAKVQAAQKVVDQFGASDIMELQLADGTKLGNNPDVIKAFSNIADFRQNVTSEDTISEMSQSGGMTAVSAQAEVDAIMNDKTHAYWDRRNVVGRQNAIKKVQELMGMIHGHT